MQSGQSEFPFSLVIPDSVKQSVMLQMDANNLSETYYLKAQFDPRDPVNYANLKDSTSMLRTDYALYLYVPHSMPEESKIGNPAGNTSGLTKTITNKIGGIAGLGSSENTTVISLEKTKFAPGEKVKVCFDCDNSQCKKPVKSFKAKLMRKISCYSGKKGSKQPLFTSEEYLVSMKYDGIPEKVKEKRIVEF